MGVTKIDKFTVEQNVLAEMAKAIGHPARIAILQLLAKKQSCVCGSIVEEIGLAQATVSQHLKALRDAGLIQGNIEGVKTCYCIDTAKVSQVNSLISELLKSCCTHPECC